MWPWRRRQPVYKPTKRGGGGALKVLWWQGPTLLNPHFAVGTKDQDGSRMFYEPLAGWDADGNLVPVLAAEIPTVENGGLAEDGTSVTWKLKQGVKWHDGQPFTADDCVFNWEYAADPATAATTIGSYQDVKVVKVDDHTIRVEFKKPTPFWADAFVGACGMIIPKHLFEPYKGAKSREAPANLAPVGTGPYLFVDFKPGDLVQGKLNPNYHMPNRPYFDTIEMKGGGDAVSAARAVLQTGEYDFAWNMQVEDEILKRLEASGKGHVEILPAGSIEHIQLNNTDPWNEVDGERSSIKTKHPFLTDPAVRAGVQPAGGSRLGAQVHLWPHRRSTPPTSSTRPRSSFRRTRTTSSTSTRRSSCWTRPAGSPGRRRAGKERREAAGGLSDLDQRAAPEDPGDRQAGLPEGRHRDRDQVGHRVGVLLLGRREPGHLSALRLRPADVHDDDDAAGPRRVHAAVPVERGREQGEQVPGPQHHPLAERGIRQAVSSRARSELDPVKRAALFIAMNDLVIKNVVVIPVVTRPSVAAVAKNLHAPLSGWDSNTYALQDWYRDA